MPMTRPVPAPEPARGDPLPLPATGLPESVPVPAGQVPRHEISATMRPWELHPSEQLFATARRPSMHREPPRRGAYTLAPRCKPPRLLMYSPRDGVDSEQSPHERLSPAFGVATCTFCPSSSESDGLIMIRSLTSRPPR